MNPLKTFLLYILRICAGVVLLPGLLSGEVLKFKNGDRLTGHWIKEEEGKIYFQSDLLGVVEVAQSQAEVEGARIAEIHDPDSGEKEGGAERPVLVEADITIEPAGSVREEERRKSWKTLAKSIFDNPVFGFLNENYPFEKWNSNLSLSFSWQDLTVSKNDISVRFDSHRKREKDEIRIDLRYDYGSQTDKIGIETKSADGYQGKVLVRRDWASKRTFLQSDSRYRKDLIRKIDDEFEQGIGLGYRIWDTTRLRAAFTTSGKAQYRQIQGISQNWETFVSLKQDFRYVFSGNFTLFEELDFSLDPRNNRNYTWDGLIRLEARLTKTLNANLRFELDYNNLVPLGVDQTQEKALLTFGFKF